MGSNEANHTESRREDWGTPRDMFDILDSVFHFKMDLCADKQNSKCSDFIDEETDIMHPIAGFSVDTCTAEDDYLWINPPYKRGGKTGNYVGRAVELAGPRGVVALVPNSTGSLWWQRHVWAHFDAFIWPRRFSFEGSGPNAKFDCAICIKWSHSQKDIAGKTKELIDTKLGIVTERWK